MNTNKGKKLNFVVYKITNLLDGRVYVGVHKTYNVNDKYMGSSKYLKKDLKELGRENFRKDILHIFDNKEDMMLKEAELVNKDFCHRPDTYNRMIGGISELAWNDMITVKDKEGNTMKVYCDDPRYLSGDLVGITNGISFENQSLLNSGYTTAKDENGNVFRVSVEDERWLTGEISGYSKGLAGNKAFEGKNHSEETKRKMSEKANQRTGEKNSMYGKKRKESFKDKVRAKLAKTFLVYDLDGNFIEEGFSINDYAKKNNLNPSSIVKTLKGKQKHHNNFIFKYK